MNKERIKEIEKFKKEFNSELDKAHEEFKKKVRLINNEID